jgi:uncharacterized protein YndB with AHSA1/START domain
MNRLGTLERTEAGAYRLRYTRHYPHPPEKVWRALIEPGELEHWFPAAIEGERKRGAKLRFVFEGEPGPATEGVMRVFEPPKVLEFTWVDDVLRFEITPEQGGSRLDFITTLGERVTAPRTAAGWHNCLDYLGERLGEPKSEKQPWSESFRAYAEMFGPGEYPAFLTDAGEAVQQAMHTRGLDGWVFRGKNDTRLELLRAREDAEIPEHAATPNEYVIVLEGRFELALGGGKVVLEAGMEFQFPEGLTVTGRIDEGTRLLRAVKSG